MDDENSLSPLPIKAGAPLETHEIVGRERFVNQVWAELAGQSVVLTAERRMGKSSIIHLLRATAQDHGFVAAGGDVEQCSSPAEFVEFIVGSLRSALPGHRKVLDALNGLISRVGIEANVGVASFKLQPAAATDWKVTLFEVLELVDRHKDEPVVLLLDELPFMLAKVRDNDSELVARDILDTLRSIRQTHVGVRMVMSGSIGLHHVLRGLRTSGTAWAPVNEMLVIEVPPLDHHDAVRLARRLLRGIPIASIPDEPTVAEAMAVAASNIPYYIHHLARGVRDRHGRDGAAITTGDVDQALRAGIADEMDSWNFRYLDERLEDYYGDDAPLARAALDAMALSDGTMGFATLRNVLSASIDETVTARLTDKNLRTLLTSLKTDHYLRSVDGGVRWRHEVVRRAWVHLRFLDQ